jgi:hypothetical protein
MSYEVILANGTVIEMNALVRYDGGVLALWPQGGSPELDDQRPAVVLSPGAWIAYRPL